MILKSVHRVATLLGIPKTLLWLITFKRDPPQEFNSGMLVPSTKIMKGVLITLSLNYAHVSKRWQR